VSLETFSPNDLVRLDYAPGQWRQMRGAVGHVVSVDRDTGFVRVLFDATDTDTGTREARDIPPAYLCRLPLGDIATARRQPQRKPPLFLHEPRDDRSEEARQAEGVSWLRANGYTVLEVGKFRTQAICGRCSREEKRAVKAFCKDCKAAVFSPNTGSTPGTPDTLISRDDWPVGAWLGMEWKDGPKGRRKPEQAALEAAGRIVVAWDLASCLTALHAFELSDSRIPVCPAVEDWLNNHHARETTAVKETEGAAR
jgi:hypothetical protein